MNKSVAGLFRSAAFGILIIATAWSQQAAGRGTVTGTVTNGSGAVVAGVKIIITSAVSGYTSNAVTDANGAFSFSDAPAGAVTLKAYDQTGKLLGSAQASIDSAGEVVTVAVKVP